MRRDDNKMIVCINKEDGSGKIAMVEKVRW